jgi:hypothetical protein
MFIAASGVLKQLEHNLEVHEYEGNHSLVFSNVMIKLISFPIGDYT